MAWVRTNNTFVRNTNNPVQTTAFANPLTPGSLIIVGLWATAVVASFSTPTDTAGNNYFDCGAGLGTTSNRSCQLFYALNTHSTASNVISVVNAGAVNTEIAAVEFTGNASSNVVDVFATPFAGNTGTGGGQNITTNSANTTGTGDLIIGLLGNPGGGTLTVGTGFADACGDKTLEFLSQSSPGSTVATWNLAVNSVDYVTIMAAFFAPSVGDTIALTGQMNLSVH